MTDVLCTKSHEYFVKEGDVLKVGLTDFAIEQLGDIVFVELPEVDTEFKKGEVFSTIESVKAASEVYLPVSGKVVEVNEKIQDTPELVNEDCFGEGWLVKLTDFDESEFTNAMKYDTYKKFVENE